MADPISAAVSAVVSYVGTAFAASAAGTATLAQTATVLAVNVGISAAATAILAPQVDAGGSPTEWKADPDAGIPFIVGRRAVAGNIVHRDEWGSDNRYQSIVTVYSGAGPINAFGTFTADGETCTFAGTYGRQSTGTWNDIFWRDTTLGAQPATALQTPADKSDPTIAGSMPAWGASYKLSGKAASMLTMAMDRDRERWPNGEPQPLQLIEGILCWDPRLDSTYPGGSGDCRLDDVTTWVYSENPYLHALKWCLGYFENDVLVGGIGAALSGIDVPAFVEGANVADANAWVISGQPTTKDDKHQVLLAMLQAGGGIYMRKAGKISCMVRTPRSSIVTVTAADTAGPFELEIGADRLTRRNTIIPRCVMESHDWEMVAQDPVSEASYVTADGGLRESGIDYPYVAIKAAGTNRHQPAQLAAYDMVDSRETIRGTVPLKPHMAQIEPGDVFTIDEPGFLLDGVECLCMSRVFEPATNIVRIGFVSETSGKHTYALGLDPTPPSPPGLTAPDIHTVAAPAVGVWTPTADSGNSPGITITGDADVVSARAIRVEYRTERASADGEAWPDDSTGWQAVGDFELSTRSIPITGLEPATSYQVAISYVSQFGVVGARRILDTVSTGELTATRATGSVTQDDLDAALEFLASANPELAAGLATLTQVGAINRVFDPLLQLGVRDNVSNTAPLSLISGDPNALAAELSVGTGESLDIVFKPRFELRPESRLMVGCEATLTGPLSEAALQVRFFDADLAEVGAPVEVATAATGARAEGFLEAADIPDGVRWGQLEVTSTSTGAGTARLQVHEPFIAYAGPNQATVEAFRDPQEEAVGRIIAQSLVDQARVFEIEGLVYETAVSRAAVLVLQEVTANVARYQTSVTYEGADGVTYALSELYAADGVSRILNIAGVIAFANPDAGGDGVTVAMEVRNAIVHILKELRLDDDAAFTFYDSGSPDVLRICIGKHPVSGDVGIWLYDSDGVEMFEADVTNEVFNIAPRMMPVGSVVGEGSGTLAATTIWASACASGECVPTGASDFDDLSVTTSVFNGEPGATVEVQCIANYLATADIFRWQYYKHYLDLLESDGTLISTFYSAIGEHSAAETVNSASANMVTAERALTKPIIAFGAVTLPSLVSGSYDASGYKARWRWAADDDDVTACSEGVNRDSGNRDATIAARIKAEVLGL